MKVERADSVYIGTPEDRDVHHSSSSPSQSEVKCKIEDQSTDNLPLVPSRSPNFLSEMSHHMNPYTQGGWSAGNGQSNGLHYWNESSETPSVFGALPTVTTPSIPGSITYKFTRFNSTILNCSVVDPQGRVACRIVTEASAPTCTVFKDNESRVIAKVHWQPHATLEIRGVTQRQRVKDWLRLSTDGAYVLAIDSCHPPTDTSS